MTLKTDEMMDTLRKMMGEQRLVEMAGEVRSVLKVMSPEEEEELRKRFGIVSPAEPEEKN